MQRRRTIPVIIAGALFAMMAGPQGPLGGFWGVEPTPGLGGPTMGALLFYALLEAVAFGAGIAWLAFGRKTVDISAASHLAIGWMLVSWFPHGAFHQSTAHTNWVGLAAIEYGFHLTMIIAAAVVVTDLLRSSELRSVPA